MTPFSFNLGPKCDCFSSRLLESASPLLSTRTPMCVVKMERKKVAAADDISDAVAKRYCAETAMIRSECNGGGDGDGEDGDQGNERDEFYPSNNQHPLSRRPLLWGFRFQNVSALGGLRETNYFVNFRPRRSYL